MGTYRKSPLRYFASLVACARFSRASRTRRAIDLESQEQRPVATPSRFCAPLLDAPERRESLS